jgi:hypothetical protein
MRAESYDSVEPGIHILMELPLNVSMEFVAAIEPSRQSSRYISIGIHSAE